MKISTKGRYALRMFLELSLNQSNEFVSLKDIAEHQNISKKYLEQIVSLFSKSGLLKTNRGYQGGYMLSKAPEQYTVGEILRITEGNLAPVTCLECSENTCEQKDSCLTLKVWEGLHKTVTDYLDGITLQAILEKHK